MIRREFLVKSGILSTGAAIAGNGLLASCRGNANLKELTAQHRQG